MRKEDMFHKNQVMHVRTEKEILTTAKSKWVVGLKYSFQVIIIVDQGRTSSFLSHGFSPWRRLNVIIDEERYSYRR